MDFKIDIQPAGIVYQSPSDKTLLESAIANNLFLQHSCKTGLCGACSADVLSGLVKNEQGELISSGSVLACSSYAQSDLSLRINYFPELEQIACVTLPCKVAGCRLVTDDIVILSLRFPPTATLHYLPGQYIDLIYNGLRRSYSIANAKPTPNGIELHIRIIPDGAFSQLLTHQIALNQLMRIEGPQGTFFVREAANPLIFLAGGTGFAPIKAMIEQLLLSNDQRMIYIYWGMPKSKDFYTDIANSWARDFNQIRYVPVVSAENDGWEGRIGYVHHAVIEDFPDLKDYHVYACGSLPMINAAKDAFVAQGLSNMNFYADAFIQSK